MTDIGAGKIVKFQMASSELSGGSITLKGHFERPAPTDLTVSVEDGG